MSVQALSSLPRYEGSDADFFALLTKVVFCTGFTRAVVEKYWSGFEEAFLQFDLDRVAEFDELIIEKLVSRDSHIIKNARKVRATVENARVCLELRERETTLAQFANKVLVQGEKDGSRVLQKTFHLIGESASKVLFTELLIKARMEMETL